MAATKRSRAKKDNVVFDSNALMSNPYCLSDFQDINAIIPIVVVEELDKHKNGNGSIAASCRIVLRKLDELATENLPKKTLADGVVLSSDNNTTLTVMAIDLALPSVTGLDLSINDNLIIECAARLSGNVKIITNDAAMRVKANLVKIKAEGYKDEGIEERNIFSDAAQILVSDQDHTDISMTLVEDGFYKFTSDAHKDTLRPNKPIIICNSNTDSITQCISVGDGRTIKAIKKLPDIKGKNSVYGLSPKNKDQRFALDFLTDDKVSVVSLIGKAGSGKTICALAAGLHKVLNEQAYESLMVIRPIIPMGRDVGYLPGTLEEKSQIWFQPVYDNLNVLHTAPHMQGQKGAEQLVNLGKLHLEVPTFMRGRSLNGVYIIVDEAQNLTAAEMKTIISRVGEGSKIVLLGDPWQGDLQKVDEWTNGLVVATDKFMNDDEASKIFAHVNLESSVRSTVAGHAARLL